MLKNKTKRCVLVEKYISFLIKEEEYFFEIIDEFLRMHVLEQFIIETKIKNIEINYGKNYVFEIKNREINLKECNTANFFFITKVKNEYFFIESNGNKFYKFRTINQLINNLENVLC